MNSQRSNFTFADLCAGIGGFRLGLESLGGDCVYSCDINTESEKTYKANYGEGFDSYDLLAVKEKDLPYADVLCAGFPCQSFSIAGKNLGFKDERGSIIFKIASIAREKQPKILFLENVANLLRQDKGQTFKEICSLLASVGYEVHYQILDSADFGVPQTRPRIYFVCIRNDIESFGFQFTRKRTKKNPLKNFIQQGDNSIPISDKWQTYIDLYTGKISVNDVDFILPKTRKKLERIDKGVDLENCIFQIRSSGIRAISINNPFPTLAVSISGGGAMIPVYSGERRHLSILEMKRIMGFFDDFDFPVSRTNAIKQLANAVCPPVINSIGKDFLSYLSDSLVVKEVSVPEHV
mgnify:CR=1 FL=1